MKHGSAVGLVAGCRDLVNSRTLEDGKVTKLEAASVPELPCGRKKATWEVCPTMDACVGQFQVKKQKYFFIILNHQNADAFVTVQKLLP